MCFCNFNTILGRNFYATMEGKAIVLTRGMLDDHHAKTAHGLIRGSQRYEITGVIDDLHAGKDAGQVVDGIHRDIPVYRSLEDYLQAVPEPAEYFIIGVATKGGYIPREMREEIRNAVSHGMSVVNGLHEFLSDDPDLQSLAKSRRVQLIDIRKPRGKDQLQFWKGTIKEVKCPKIAVLGTDCAIGKRTTARLLMEAATQKGLVAEMVFTGQTGWLQGGRYGFILDSTYNDFVSGELEQAIVSCYRELNPDMIFLEGQAALQNPTGPCGAEFLISGRAEGVILQHAPGRKYFGNDPELGPIPPLESEIDLIRLYGSETLAITLNVQGLDEQTADLHQREISERLGLPVVQPLKEGVFGIIEMIEQRYAQD